MSMAASLPSSCPSFTHLQISLPCSRIRAGYLQKSIACFSARLPKRTFSFKICITIPTEYVAHPWMSKTSTSVGSFITHVKSHENLVSSSVSISKNSLRSKTLVDHSSNSSDDVNDFERQLQELFDDVKMLIIKGNESDAVDLLRANYEVVKGEINSGARGIEEAATLDIIALGYMAVGDLKFVGSLLHMLNEIVDGLEDGEPLLESVLMHMGSMYSALGKFDQSVLVYKRAIGMLESMYGKCSTYLVLPLLGMAKVLSSIGRATKAVEVYYRAITILESSRGAESEDLVGPLLGLGNLLIKEGRAADAENPFLRILSIYMNLYGENDGKVAMALCFLAHVKCATGNAEEAIDLYRRAIQVIKDANYVAVDDNIMEKMRIDLAELLHVVGRVKEGRELLEECLLITEKDKGKEHPSSITHLLNLANSYSQSKNFVEAERLLRTSLEIMMQTTALDDQSITFPMLHLAVTLYHLRRDEEAEQLALEVLRIREKAFGKESLPVGEALDVLICIQSRLGKPDTELLVLLKRVLNIQEKEFGVENEEVMQTLKKILFYVDKIGKKDEKFSVERRLSVLRRKYKETVHY